MGLAEHHDVIEVERERGLRHREPKFTGLRDPRRHARLADRGGRRKVLFGSNYPMIFPERALADLERLGLDEEARELYLHENTRRVFSLAV